MKKLILVRHVLTEDNKLAKLSGHIDSKVSEEGKLQIKEITDFLKNEKIDRIYTTTSSRTKETVKYLAEINSIEVQESEDLKEISFGDFEGKDFKDIQKNYPDEFNKMIEEGYEYTYPNGESLIDCFERVSKEIQCILDDADENETILVCSHAGTIRNVLTYLISNTFEYHWNFKIDNASVSVVEIDNGFAVINKLNDTSFLK
ncbi:MAG: histidine phosphatase family protein [Intestinibacter bartlettii]|uniref:histidine phosphatase family protein n=1 Tax=Intestinibacter bartlettii TaxID=261299 RepID=UPI0026EE6A48|nr:histidine phosphatase family protein [Intestinibacter bartlettii]MDO5010071.1 histidine phosphatase family protein [Intestinibacter bartlettii]